VGSEMCIRARGGGGFGGGGGHMGGGGFGGGGGHMGGGGFGGGARGGGFGGGAHIGGGFGGARIGGGLGRGGVAGQHFAAAPGHVGHNGRHFGRGRRFAPGLGDGFYDYGCTYPYYNYDPYSCYLPAY
jgi:hypothetical protein